MSTRSQKRKNNLQESTENVSEDLISPVVVESPDLRDQDVLIAGPSNARSPRIENSTLESLRVSLKEKITSEIKNLIELYLEDEVQVGLLLLHLSKGREKFFKWVCLIQVITKFHRTRENSKWNGRRHLMFLKMRRLIWIVIQDEDENLEAKDVDVDGTFKMQFGEMHKDHDLLRKNVNVFGVVFVNSKELNKK